MRWVVLATPLVTFAISLAIHVTIWRARRPRADMTAILRLLIGAPVLAFAAAASLLALGVVPRWVAMDELAAIALLHLALSAAYVQTYPASQARSPSLLIALAVGDAPDGLTREEIAARLPGGELVGTRIEDLSANALVRRKGDLFVASPAGLALAGFFHGYRRLLGLGRGKG
jgi:hypothetical protein